MKKIGIILSILLSIAIVGCDPDVPSTTDPDVLPTTDPPVINVTTFASEAEAVVAVQYVLNGCAEIISNAIFAESENGNTTTSTGEINDSTGGSGKLVLTTIEGDVKTKQILDVTFSNFGFTTKDSANNDIKVTLEGHIFKQPFMKRLLLPQPLKRNHP